jgi:putative tricarboxylic transport membrane protein
LRDRLTRCIPYALVGTAAGYLYYVASQFEFHRRGANLGPDFWPKLALALVMATCVYEILRIAVIGTRRELTGVLQDIVEDSVRDFGDDSDDDPAPLATRRPALLIAGIALTALYVWAIQTLGFFLATVPYLVAFIALGGYRRWVTNVIVSFAGTFVMMFFFMKVVYVSLPIGREPFAQLTFLLMRLMGIR